MDKRSQKIVLFIEPRVVRSVTPSKIGNLFMNRFAIDEDQSHEILKIFELENTLFDLEQNQLTKAEGLGQFPCFERHFEWLPVISQQLAFLQKFHSIHLL